MPDTGSDHIGFLAVIPPHRSDQTARAVNALVDCSVWRDLVFTRRAGERKTPESCHSPPIRAWNICRRCRLTESGSRSPGLAPTLAILTVSTSDRLATIGLVALTETPAGAADGDPVWSARRKVDLLLPPRRRTVGNLCCSLSKAVRLAQLVVTSLAAVESGGPALMSRRRAIR